MKKAVLFKLLFISIFILSCNQSKKTEQEELEQLMITQKNEDSANYNEKNEDLNLFFIKAPADSTYTGDAEEQYPNGLVKYKGFYRFGKRHGEWLYFYPNGNLWSECVYNRGKMNGKSNVYYANGKLYYSGFYKNDMRDSVWLYYDSTGEALYQEFYKNNKLIKKIK